MKATIVLIADNDAENYGRKLMLEAHRYGKTGFEMARLPQHVSLKQPFVIPCLEDMERFFDRFVKELDPFDIEFVDMDIVPSNVLGGAESGCMSLQVKETPQLVDAQKRLNEELCKIFGPCPAEHDDDYVFHMTFAIGGADYESYQRAYNELIKSDYNQTFTFGKLGLLYYDDDDITPGTYFCYKVCDI
ncbi:MAG: 2'-5' RNA ligase family protein [Muribaculaceae bacterium]|nr:2'-5' RNA ligase family protein [Roseburia sp.]MCM1429915.1 2'-5' RNA ligase family protein [Muribaculaceae bacterium]MCM1493058.1 2'-5' RNA ligase family protein [Muribaculaceae bacterium]